MERAPIAESKSVCVEEPRENIELPMGHRSSKSAIDNSTSSAETYRVNPNSNQTNLSTVTAKSGGADSDTNRIAIPLQSTATINVQIQESPTINTAPSSTQQQTQQYPIDSDSSSSLASLAGSSLQNRQIIIKIQLAKMENGNEPQTTSGTTHIMDSNFDESSIISGGGSGAGAGALSVGSDRDRDRDSLEMSAANNGTQFVNLTLNGNFIYADDSTNDLVSFSSDNGRVSRTAGGCTNLINNNIRDFSGRMNTLQIQEDWEQQHRSDALPEYCEVLDDTVGNYSTSYALAKTNEQRHSDSSLADNISCLNGHRRTKAARSPSSSGLSRRRCRDAFRRILEPSSNKSLNKSKKQSKKHSDSVAQTQHSSSSSYASSSSTVLSGISGTQRHLTAQPQILTTPSLPGTAISSSSSSASSSSMSVTMTAPSTSNNLIPISIATMGAATNPSNTATIWTPSQNDLIIPITSPQQFVVVQCPPTSVVTLGRIDYNSIRLSSTEIGKASVNNVNGFISSNVPTESLVKQVHNGPIVHSQVDFVHCLVPDLEKIINSSFYWGKIDRYEAERLLEGKPEGTFLLRDSAQEEYLFSVTFRKFGRSLHARIEQSGHKFGFDCHDPSVFTSPTVTGLLQHYKDPSCVMFFEPMLTIPLHRKMTFSLQELARGVIVTNTTYDGINELGLPLRLRAFLKEYYYKQKLRVKPFDKTVYSCT